MSTDDPTRPSPRRTYSLSEARRLLGIGRTTAYDFMKNGRLEYYYSKPLPKADAAMRKRGKRLFSDAAVAKCQQWMEHGGDN